MPVSPTYPGVYIEEVPSGVRTITGVSTSITAFLGSAKRGSIDKAVRVQSFADFERRFGGLQADSEMSYAVRQFFLNGGSDSWVIRLAKDAVAATATLLRNSTDNVLSVTAVEAGRTGNFIEVRVDYQTANSASTFNLTLNYAPPDSPSDARSETFVNLSMNSQDARYVENVVNGVSQQVKVKRVAANTMLSALPAGTSTSGDLGNVQSLVDAKHNQFRIAVNGLPPVKVQFAVPADTSGADAAAALATLCAAIQSKVVAAANGNTALSGFTCTAAGSKIKMTSGQAGELSTVDVLPGESNDAAGVLKLGTANGGEEKDAVSAIRPLEQPGRATLTSGVLAGADLDTLPDAAHTTILLGLDGYGPDPVVVGDIPAAGADLAAKLMDVAARIQSAVRALKPSNPAYTGFTCAPDSANTRLILASGSRGTGSAVLVAAPASKSIANELKLLSGAAVTQPANKTLTGGTESPYTDADAYNLFIGDRSQRKGIFALEEVDIFNLLCLPGATDPGILADAAAYCKERRAFLIADAPSDQKRPEAMVSTAAGTQLPKSDYAAVYYPWIKVPDPLKNGKPRICAPCGSVAGLYARTDTTRGVWKAPAGTEANLVGAVGLEYVLTDGENGTLNPVGVNCLRTFPVYGAVCWGARTLRGADQMTSEYKYVPVRRLALFIEESLFRGTQWVVFEPNDEPLWAQIRLNVGAFMHNLFRQGAFQGRTPREAYLVKCDSETTTQNDVNLGIVNILVGFAPLKPAEFVIIRLQQLAGQLEV